MSTTFKALAVTFVLAGAAGFAMQHAVAEGARAQFRPRQRLRPRRMQVRPPFRLGLRSKPWCFREADTRCSSSCRRFLREAQRR